MKVTDREVRVPLCAVSTTSSLANKTGSWKFSAPIFIDRVSPCTQQCPAGEDITGYMYLAAQMRFEEAWQLVMKDNPFPAIMGRICYHTCETRCNRADHDEAISIHTVERFIGDYGLDHNLKVEVHCPDIDRGVAVVGAGPAGLSAAYHLRRKGYRVTVFDFNGLPGGLMRYGIPFYRLPKEVLSGEIRRLYDMGIDFQMGIKIGKDLGWDEIDREFDAIFIAIGTYQEVDLPIHDPKRGGVYHALEFLHEVNLFKSLKIGKKLAVIGGGNSAIDCARVSRRLGADVTLIYRRGEEEMPAHPEEINMARKEGVRFIFLASPQEIHGDGRVSWIRLARMALREPDSSGRRKPIPTGETFDLACQSVILAIGESTRVEDLPPFLNDGKNPIQTDHLGQTTSPKFFAGGDIIDIPHSVSHAIGSGRRAALGIDRFLRRERTGDKLDESPLLLFPRRNPVSEVIEYDNLNPFYFDHRPGMKTHNIPVRERIIGFQEVETSPSLEEVIYEARRCFNCGSCTECGNCYLFCPENAVKKDPDGYGYVVDMDYCKGCGICVHECPRGAMKMEFME
jgi:NADPH-dependent glutamate synthase beta subunit-like oxidoreductase/Pyruvate/2-oxoacid:ferredoxin oxidoreductase delta subunit